MNREDLLKTLKLAAPALLSDNESVLPILKSFKFTGTHVLASNDVISVCLSVPVEETGIVQGKKLITFLGACSSKEVKFSKGKKDNLLVKCASAQLRLSLGEEDEWPFELPDIKEATSISVNEKFFEAIDYCSSQTPDTGLGGWQGGILFVPDKTFDIYGVGKSRATISYCSIKKKISKESFNRRILAPSSFCKTAVTIANSLGKAATLHISEDTAVLDWNDGKNLLTTKLLNVDMPDIVSRFSNITDSVGNFITVNDDLSNALKRASMIGNEGSCQVTSDEGNLRLRAKGSGASLNELVKIGGVKGNIDYLVAANLICQRLDKCNKISFGEEATVMKSEEGNFIYIAANRVDREED